MRVDGAGASRPPIGCGPASGSSVEVPPPPPEELAPGADRAQLVYEDEHVLVVDKPAGMVVHPGAGRADAGRWPPRCWPTRPAIAGVGGPRRPGIVHRLDKDTSGLLVMAKTQPRLRRAHRASSRGGR